MVKFWLINTTLLVHTLLLSVTNLSVVIDKYPLHNSCVTLSTELIKLTKMVLMYEKSLEYFFMYMYKQCK